MDRIKIAISGRIADVESAPEVVADNTEYEVAFSFNDGDGWNPAVPMTALFVRRDAKYTAVVMDAGETVCTMPPQTGTNIVYVGLTQDNMRTTTPATIKVRRSIRTVAHDPLPAPTEDVYAQILAAYAGIKILSGKGAPTTETEGKVNQLYRDEDTQRLYICTATDGGYTWAAVSGGGSGGGSVDVDDTLTKAGYAADAKAAGDAIGKKIDKAQGTGNAGKILGIGADGNVTPQDKPVQALAGASAPTTATAGVVGQEYYVIVNNAVTEMYVCTAAENGTYTWDRVEFGAEIDDTSTEPTKVWSAEKCNQLSEEIVDCIKSPVSAAVGQTIKVSAVGENGKPTEWEAVNMPEQVQADWNQNDSTQPDYVKNRPFYTGDMVETNIFEEQTANFTVNEPIMLPFTDDEATNQLYDSIWDGATIRVVWDGEIYDCVTSNGEAGGDNEPFFLSLAGPEIYATESGEHTFSITYIKYNVYKIEEKYLPDTVIKSKYSAHIMPAINLSSVFDFSYFSTSDATSGSNSITCTIEQWNDISSILNQARNKYMVYAVNRQVERCGMYNDHKLKIWGSRISETGGFKVNVSILEYDFRNKTLTATYCAN